MRQTLAAAEGNWEDESDEIVKQNTLLLRRNSVQSNIFPRRSISNKEKKGLFNGYHYDATEAGGATGGVQNLLQKQQATLQSSSQSFVGNTSSQTTQTLSASMEHNK